MFYAVLDRSRTPTDDHAAAQALKRIHSGDVVGEHREPGVVLRQSLLHSTPEARREDVPTVDPRSGRVVVSWVRLDNRAELARAFGWAGAEAGLATDPQYVLAAYDRWGPDCAAHLEGDFAFVIYDPLRHGCYAARDALGVRPLFYVDEPRLFAVATSAALLVPLPGVRSGVRDEWMARTIHFVGHDWSSTALEGVTKLPPGHWLWADGEKATTQPYHQFLDDAPYEDRRRDQWLDDYRRVLEEAVRCRIRTDSALGVETSGGLDSSTVLALIATIDPSRRDTLHSFAFVLEALEPEYVLETSRVFEVRHNHVSCALDPYQKASRRGWEVLGYPAEHGSSVGHLPFYELAQQLGVRTLHSGHGGDEGVSSTGALAMREHLAHRNWRALLTDLPNAPHRRPAWVLREAWRQRRKIARRSILADAMVSRLAYTPLSDVAFEQSGVDLATRSATRWDAAFESVNGFVIQDRLMPLLSTRTAECSVVAAGYGVEYRWPLLDRRLLQQYLSTPAVWKYGRGASRYLHRRAIDGVVPDKVTWKPTKDMSSAASPTPVPALPKPRFEDLHPEVAKLLDPDRWNLGASGDALVPMQRHRVGELSAWLWERASDQ